MVAFYNQADQDLYKKYQYLPQEKYRLGLNLPKDPVSDPVINQGIVNTNAFANSGGDFNPAGNMFGEGTAVKPVFGNTYIDTVKREGVNSLPAYERLIDAGGTTPGGMYQTDFFPGTENELADAMGRMPNQPGYDPNMDMSEDAFQKAENKRGFLSKLFNRAKQSQSVLPSWARTAMTVAGLINPLTAIPKLIGMGGDGPKYGIAGLTDQQKGLYDSLASQGMLYKTPSGYKTFDGKNFSQVDEQTYENYFDNKIDRFGSLKNYEDYLDEEPDFRKNLRKVYDYNKIGYTGLTGEDNLEDARQKQSDAIIKNEMLVREIRKKAAKDKAAKDKIKNKTVYSQNNSPGYPGNQAPSASSIVGGSTSGGGGSGTGTSGADSTGQSTGSSGGYNDGNYCFDPSTPIQMADGSTKKIKNIQLGDNTKGGDVTGVFQFKASDEIHDYKGVTVAGSHYVKEDGRFIMVKDSPLAVKIDKIPVVYSLDTSGRRIFINDIEFADYNGDGVAKNFLSNAGVDLSGFDKEVLRQVENRLI